MSTASKAPNEAPWEELSKDANRDRRRERRINLAFPVELFGFTITKRYFTERGVTVNVSKGGCQLRLKNQVEARSVLAIRVAHPESSTELPQKPMLFMVSWVQRAGDKWAVGLLALQPETIWPVVLPEKLAAESRQ